MPPRFQLGLAICFVSIFPLAQTALADGDTKKVAEGKKLYAKLDCAACHSISGTGGCLAPDLNGVSTRRSDKYIRLRLGKETESEFIQLIGHAELIPHPRFAAAQVNDLLAYLKTLSDKKLEQKNPHIALSATHKQPSKTEVSPAPTKSSTGASKNDTTKAGKEIFYKGGCLACHSVGGLGGSTAPALDGISKRRSRSSIESLVNSPSEAGAGIMPRAPLSPSQRESLIDFLMTLPSTQKK